MNIKKQQADILGCKVDLVNLNQAVGEVAALLNTREKAAQIITVNAEILYEASKNPELTEVINSAHMVTPDGIGVVWAATQLGGNPQGRVTGIELLEALCQEGARQGWRMFFFGAAPGVAEQAADKLSSRYPGLLIAGTIHGYFSPEGEGDIIAAIKSAAPDILFVGLGAPRQEYWISQHKEELDVPVCIGIGGSFDVLSGLKKRAPELMIKLNLEWFYRLASEPSRIKRQMALPKFVWMILRQKYGGRL